jgi:glycosyltransferase involved in cell wall biosynthesis
MSAPGPIVHVAQIRLDPETGMGRVACHWRDALAARGRELIHIGAAEVGPVHPALFPWAAWRHYRSLKVRPAALLVHEPSGAPFLGERRRLVAFSHGVERRAWQADLERAAAGEIAIRRRSRWLFPLWRLRPGERTLRHARAVLVLNRDDLAFVERRYRRRPADLLLFRNGVQPAPPPGEGRGTDLLFVGTWMPRKGIKTLIEALRLLHGQGIDFRLVLAGTGGNVDAVLADWPEELRPRLRVIPRFPAGEELDLYRRAPVFLLPSFFEGQPLALLQSMAAGCCCVASDIAGNRDLVVHGESGLLHPPGDPEALAGRVAECLAGPGLRERLGEGARRAMAGRTWEAVSAEVAGFIESVIP